MQLIQICKNPEKEIFSIKIGSLYYGVITGSSELHVTTEGFESPLKASNNARSLKKKYNIKADIKKSEKTDKNAKTIKINQNVCLYTEAEIASMASLTNLRFREAWVIRSLDGSYVKDTQRKNSVTDYVGTKEEATLFPSYESASLRLKTLDLVVKKGHRLQRFFIENKEKWAVN